MHLGVPPVVERGPVHRQRVHSSCTGAVVPRNSLPSASWQSIGRPIKGARAPTEGPLGAPTGPIPPMAAKGGNRDVPALERLWTRQEGDGAAERATDQLDSHLIQENHAAAAAYSLAARFLPTVCVHRGRGARAQRYARHHQSSGMASTARPQRAPQMKPAKETDRERLRGTRSQAGPPTSGSRGTCTSPKQEIT